MVAVHDDGGVLHVALGVGLHHLGQVVVGVVGAVVAARAHVAAQDGVGVGVAGGLHVPVAVDEGVRRLGGHDGVEHDGVVARRRVLHAHGHLQARRHEAVLLVFHRAGSHGHVGQQVGEEAVVLGVEHLVGAEHARLLDHGQVHVADGADAGQKVGLAVGVGLVQHAHVAQAERAGLVGVEARDEDELVGHLLLHLGQARAVLEHRVLAVGRAGADDDELAGVGALHHGGDGGVIGHLALLRLGRQRHLGLDVLRVGQAALELHSHRCGPRSLDAARLGAEAV